MTRLVWPRMTNSPIVRPTLETINISLDWPGAWCEWLCEWLGVLSRDDRYDDWVSYISSPCTCHPHGIMTGRWTDHHMVQLSSSGQLGEISRDCLWWDSRQWQRPVLCDDVTRCQSCVTPRQGTRSSIITKLLTIYIVSRRISVSWQPFIRRSRQSPCGQVLSTVRASPHLACWHNCWSQLCIVLASISPTHLTSLWSSSKVCWPSTASCQWDVKMSDWTVAIMLTIRLALLYLQQATSPPLITGLPNQL